MHFNTGIGVSYIKSGSTAAASFGSGLHLPLYSTDTQTNFEQHVYLYTYVGHPIKNETFFIV